MSEEGGAGMRSPRKRERERERESEKREKPFSPPNRVTREPARVQLTENYGASIQGNVSCTNHSTKNICYFCLM